jgi:Ethanolamine utilization protein EutJ (predicted chaperonin)
MPNKNESTRIHLTRGEQIALYGALSKIPAQGREGRRAKVAAMSAFGLDWIKEVLDDPTEKIDTLQLVQTHAAALAAGHDELKAMNGVINQLTAVLVRDPFAGQRKERIVVDLTSAQIEWTLAALDKAEPSGAADLEIAAVETRLGRAERGSYELPADLALKPVVVEQNVDAAP